MLKIRFLRKNLKTQLPTDSNYPEDCAPNSCTENGCFPGIFPCSLSKCKNESVDKDLRVRESLFLPSSGQETGLYFQFHHGLSLGNLCQCLHVGEKVSLRHIFIMQFKGHYKLNKLAPSVLDAPCIGLWTHNDMKNIFLKFQFQDNHSENTCDFFLNSFKFGFSI